MPDRGGPAEAVAAVYGDVDERYREAATAGSNVQVSVERRAVHDVAADDNRAPAAGGLIVDAKRSPGSIRGGGDRHGAGEGERLSREILKGARAAKRAHAARESQRRSASRGDGHVVVELARRADA